MFTVPFRTDRVDRSSCSSAAARAYVSSPGFDACPIGLTCLESFPPRMMSHSGSGVDGCVLTRVPADGPSGIADTDDPREPERYLDVRKATKGWGRAMPRGPPKERATLLDQNSTVR